MRVVARWMAVAAAAAVALGGCDEEIVCPGGQQVCEGRCAEVAVDPDHCGRCGNPCGAGEACKAGACTDCASACGDGQTCENGVCRADLYVACLSTNDVRGVTAALQAAGPSRTVDQGPVALAWLGERLWVSHTFAPPTVVGFTPNVDLVSRFTLGGGDLQDLQASDGLLFVTDSVASTLVVADPERGVVDEIALAPAPGVAANPTGVAVNGAVAAVALYGFAAAPSFGEGQEIVLVDVGPSGACTTQPCGTVTRRIGLDVPRSAGGPGAYDPPGFPFPTRVAFVGTRAFVTLANLAEQCFPPPYGCSYTTPAGNGRLAVVDAASSAPPAFVDLGADCTNPGALALDGSTLWISCSGTGKVVPVNTSASPPAAGDALTMPEFFVPGAIAACGGALYVGDQYSGTVARLATSGGPIDTETVCTGGEFYDLPSDLACPGTAP